MLSNKVILKQINVLKILPSNHSIWWTLNPDTTLCVHFVCAIENINQSTPFSYSSGYSGVRQSAAPTAWLDITRHLGALTKRETAEQLYYWKKTQVFCCHTNFDVL